MQFAYKFLLRIWIVWYYSLVLIIVIARVRIIYVTGGGEITIISTK